MSQAKNFDRPAYGEELDSILESIENYCRDCSSKYLGAADVENEDFGVGVYWQKKNTERFVLVTAYSDQRAYISAGASSRDNSEEVIELGFVALEDLDVWLEAAGSTAEEIDLFG